MKLKLSFNSQQAADKFLAKTREKDLDSVHIGLINMALKDPELAAAEAVGDPIEFHVRQADGTWTTEVVADPVARILNGDVLEPADAPIKMLSTDSVLDTDGHQWAQNRIANRYPPLIDAPYTMSFDVQHGVEVIVVDSGINLDHTEFDGVDINELWVRSDLTDAMTDDLGHGTAIAALIAGKTLGMTNAASLQIVRISNAARKPTLGELGEALDAILTHHQATPDVPKVVNVSWMVPTSQYLSDKFTALINAGVMVVAAAGNTNGANIDEATPAGLAGVFTVAGSTRDDNELFSVFGVDKKIDLYAPGENIYAPGVANTTGYVTVGGSSFAAAFVSGVAALIFSTKQFIAASDVQVVLKSDSTKNALFLNPNVSQEENRLLHRPDSNSIPADCVQFIGSFKRSSVSLLAADVRVLMPQAILQRLDDPDLVWTLTPGNEEMAAIIGASTVGADGKVQIKVADDFEFAANETVKQLYFTVTAAVPEMVFQTPKVYFFLLAENATFTDVRPYLEDLSASSSFNFLEEEIGSKKGG